MNWYNILMDIIVIVSALVAVVFYYKSAYYKYFRRKLIDWVPFGLVLAAFAFGIETIFLECNLYFESIGIVHNLLSFLSFFSFTVGFAKANLR